MKKIFFVFLLVSLHISCKKNNDDTTEMESINFTGDIESCSDFVVRKFLNSEDFSSAITIRGLGREKLRLSSEYSEFELPNNSIDITISEWDSSAYDMLCNDVPLSMANEIALFNAVSGEVKIKVSNVEEIELEKVYRITLELNNVIFENNEGDEKNISNLIIENSGVGWLPG